MNDLHINGEFRRDPWGYAGMTVRIYRAKKDGLARRSLGAGGSLYAMRSARGVIATARSLQALDEYARAQRWVPTFRASARDGREVWVSIPE